MLKLDAGKVNVMLDGQFGSTGKGLFAGYVAKHNKINIAMTNAAPNAGHTYCDEKGTKFTCFHLPVSGVLQKDSLIYLCAGTIIDPAALADEMDQLDVSWDRLRIHPRAAIIEKGDKIAEGAGSATEGLASTQKGCGHALSRKINRSAMLAKDWYADQEFIQEVDLSAACAEGKTIFMEVPQGMDLSLNGGLSYPHCTSREVSVSQALSDACVHPFLLGKVAVTMRTFPIRVGHIYQKVHGYGNEKVGEKIVGNSGPFYPDQKELAWCDVGVTPELTTVTKRKRRIASWSWTQYRKCMDRFRPNYVFLNFCNYFRSEKDFEEHLNKMDEIRSTKSAEFFTGFGPNVEDVYSPSETSLERLWFQENR
jgi:adenylosuccinate synthase